MSKYTDMPAHIPCIIHKYILYDSFIVQECCENDSPSLASIKQKAGEKKSRKQTNKQQQ